MRRVLFVLYYFPPAGGAGVQRGLKFLRYLPEFGWHPTVLTVRSNSAFPVRDETLLAEVPAGLPVHRTRCPELYGLYRRASGQRLTTDLETASQSAAEGRPVRRLLRAIRAASFIPDGRMLWRPFSIREGKKILASEPYDLIFSSGPPFTCHLIGRDLHRASGLPWVADYRDPWTQATFYPRRPAWARAIDLRLEASCVREAACTVTVGDGMAAEMLARYPRLERSRVAVIPNGYDEGDFAAVPVEPPRELRITHSGSLFRGRIPFAFFEALAGMLAREGDFAQRLRLCFAGRIDEEARALLASPPFDRVSELPGYLPHAGSIALLRRSRLLLLATGTDAQSRNLLTGKVYEYLASGIPILALAPPDGDAARVIREAGAGWVIDPDDRVSIRSRLEEIWRIERSRPASEAPASAPLFGLSRAEEVIARYARRELTRRLAAAFDTCARG